MPCRNSGLAHSSPCRARRTEPGMGSLLLRLLLAACRSSRCSCMNWRMPSSGVRACVRVRVTVRALPLLTREPQRPGRRPQHDADADHCPGHSRLLSSRTQAFLAPCFARGLHPRPRTNPAARNGGRGHSGGGAAVVRHSRHAGRASAARTVAQGAGHLSSVLSRSTARAMCIHRSSAGHHVSPPASFPSAASVV